jgi:hypothetical protein
MKKIFLGILVSISLSATAQLRLPQPSPAASVSQTIGTTDITVKYSRPSLKGRDVFGGVVVLDKVWRTGANAATQITLSNEIAVNGQKVAAGTYSVFSIPTKGDWTLIFNKDITATEQSYAADKDVFRTTVKAVANPKTESFTIDFSDVTDSSAVMNIYWSDKKVITPIAVETAKMLEAAINKANLDNANIMRTAADYLQGKGKYEQALKLVNSSIGSIETFRNVWTKAQILGKMGIYTEALPLAKKALELGQNDTSGGFANVKGAIEKGIADFTEKMPVAAPVTPIKKKKAM